MINYDNKILNSDTIGEIVRLQYRNIDPSRSGGVTLRNIVDTFTTLDEAISDLSSSSENEIFGENNDDNDDDHDDHDGDEENNTSLQSDKNLHEKTESDTKRKSSEAGCSEQNITFPEESEFIKRMKMNTPPAVQHFLSSQSSSSDLWETVSTSDSSMSSDDHDYNDSDSLVSSGIDDPNDSSTDEFGRIYNSVFNRDDIDDSDDTNSEVARELLLYRFLSERKENELSKLLKSKIDLLPVPAMLKKFLNYNKED